ILGAHTIATHSLTLPGVVVTLDKVETSAAGQKPKVTFTLKDGGGNALPVAQLNRLAMVLAGPTTDYGSTNWVAKTRGDVTETPTATNTPGGWDGVCTYQSTNATPGGAHGTFPIGVEARRTAVLLPGTAQQVTTNYGAVNKIINFSVDGSR